MELIGQLFLTNELTRFGDNKIVNELYKGVQNECEISNIMIKKTVNREKMRSQKGNWFER